MLNEERTAPDRLLRNFLALSSAKTRLSLRLLCIVSLRSLRYLAEDTMALPNNILARVLEILYADFLESDECIDIGKHHCSLLYPCIAISKSTTFKPVYTFRLISSNWNKVFLSMAKLDRHASHRIVQGPRQTHTYIYNLLRKSVVLGRYRIFRNLDTQHGTFLIVPLIFFFFRLTIIRLSRCSCGI